MKTIKDIAAEMRDLAAHRDWHNHANQSNRERMLDFADRIEKAVTNCNQLKMRETVAETEKRIDKVISILTEIPDSCGYGGLLEDAADELCDLKEEFVKPALAARPRNCDLYKTESEAYQAYLTAMKNATKKTYVYFEPWLFAEAKGEEK